MADRCRVAQYFKMKAPNKAGQAARALGALTKAGVNLLAFSGFPRGSGAQMDFVVTSAASFKSAAKRAKLKVQGPKACLLIAGADRRGTGAKLAGKLASRKINITALQAISGGGGRYAAILFVKPRDVKKAARALGGR